MKKKKLGMRSASGRRWAGACRLAAVVLAGALAFSMAGCSAGGTSTGESSGADASSSPSASATGDSAALDTAAMDFDYSKRDKDPSYDDAAATHIALSGTAASVDGAGAAAEGSTVTISQEGTYVVSGTLTDGQLVVETPDDVKVQVVLAGAAIHNEDGPALYVKQTDKCFITLADGTQNTLTDGANYVLDDGDEPYATLFSKDDLTINGTGALNVTSAYRHAICSKDDLVITGGTFTVDAVEDALRGRDCVKIADGSFTLTSGEDAIKSNNDEDATRGFVCIDGGMFAISAGDDAVHAETVLNVNGGTVDVASCYEGYEGQEVHITGGDTHIVATDDGINAASSATASDVERAQTGGMPLTGMAEGGMGMGDASCLIEVTGGYTVVDAAGDGIDSNGSFAMSGGVLLVCGPTDGANGAFDYDLEATISGGTLIAVGSAGMAQNLTGGTQPFAFANVSGSAGQNIAVTDGEGTVLASFTAARQFATALVSASGMTEGGTYALVVGGTVAGANADGYASSGTVSGGTSTEVTASTTATGGLGGLGMGGGGMPAGQPGDIQRGGPAGGEAMPGAGGAEAAPGNIQRSQRPALAA